ncbi:of very long chain fatty acids protein 6 [Seminavis robusta]|uniref:Elongation of fatty acids protein n=1 Tax=Seminavis robusta TaxID=568900 RepID=A0A9N8HNF8_9STRA|nr:of very long chain fatty acids protein 6 [Seminavis robusta]|eukprot:Sro1207_g252500.1 of very long chain fatty acids protein 6 (293) ;mRNA; r:19616-20669
MWYPTEPTNACLRESLRDLPYEELSCVYPTLGKTYFDWEYPSKGVDNALTFMENNSWLPIVTTALYGLAIYAGQRYMADRPAWDWRYRLAAWNLFLAVFSAVGFFRTAPQLLHNLWYYDFKTNMCTHGMTVLGFGPSAYWVYIFGWSKFFELIDTFFIVVRKKNLMFLHWYHHVTVLICSWHTIVTQNPTGIIFAVVNYGVHMLMYFYYFLMAIKCKPNWFNPLIITVGQILQMVVGVGVCIGVYSWAKEDGCHASLNNIKAALLMYASYLYLFCEFFFKRYMIKAKRTKTL